MRTLGGGGLAPGSINNPPVRCALFHLSYGDVGAWPSPDQDGQGGQSLPPSP